MITRITALVSLFFPLLCSSVQGQFLPNMPQYDNGVNLSFFLQADINHDGKIDIVGLRSPRANTFDVTVLLGNGTGGFGTPLNTTITGIDNVCLTELVVRDFNGDGHLDVAFSGKDHVTGVYVWAVMLGNGNGTFQTPRETPVNVGCTSAPIINAVIAGDFNGDGKLDIAYGNVSVMLGKGDGTFSSPVTTPINLYVLAIAAGDFNNDKKLDLAFVVGPFSGSPVYLCLGNGDGTFKAPTLVSRGGYWPLVAADLNGDGNLDLIADGVVLLGDGTGHFPTIHNYNGFGTLFAVQDLNGDGYPDIAYIGTGGNGPTNLGTFLNNGDGSFTAGSREYIGDGSIPGVGFGFVAADLNGDGKVDLAFGNGAGGISVLVGNGNGTFKGNFYGHAAGLDFRVGDFNRDLKPDLVPVPTGRVYLGKGDGTFNAAAGPGCFGLSIVAVGDFNHDGKLDLAGFTMLNGVPVIGACLGNGDGSFGPMAPSDQGIQHKLVLPGDFNNDGKLDLAASDQHGVSILLGNGDGSFQNGIPTPVSASFPSFAVGDFNNDGKLDIAAMTSSGVAVFLGKGNGTFGAPIISPGVTVGYMAVTDLNKDGKRDLVVVNDGGITVLLGKGNGAFGPAVHYAVSAITRPIIADFNGDSNLDVVVGAQGAVFELFFGDGHGRLSAPTTFRAGGFVSGIAEGDFNGDKKPDLAVVVEGIQVTFLHQ